MRTTEAEPVAAKNPKRAGPTSFFRYPYCAEQASQSTLNASDLCAVSLARMDAKLSIILIKVPL